jgi:protein SCO1/2
LLLLAWAAFAAVTSNFSALTSDGVRRVELARAPREVPRIALIDSAGRPMQLADYGRPSAQATFVTLTYVRCQTVCRASTSGQAWMQNAIREHQLEGRVRLLTLSFDSESDTTAVLAAHARRLDADPHLWRFATVKAGTDRARLLEFFGVVVIPDGLGGYSHNAAHFVIGRDGRLSRAYDMERPDLALVDYLNSFGP